MLTGCVACFFSLDGTRIITGDGETEKLWDARTGEEIRSETIANTMSVDEPRTSPDGRHFAHVVHRRVEIVPLQLDAQELEYRKLVTQPDPRRYREGYDSAKEAGDEFATQFYLNLLPVPERTRLLAKEIVEPLFASWGLRDDVVAALADFPAADPEIQAACVELTETWPEEPSKLNELAWSLV